MRHGVRGAIIDPYNYIQKGRDVSETEWVSRYPDKAARVCSGTWHSPLVRSPSSKDDADQSGNVPAPKGYDISVAQLGLPRLTWV